MKGNMSSEKENNLVEGEWKESSEHRRKYSSGREGKEAKGWKRTLIQCKKKEKEPVVRK